MLLYNQSQIISKHFNRLIFVSLFALQIARILQRTSARAVTQILKGAPEKNGPDSDR